MIEKKFTPKRTICKVTFRVPEDWAGKEVSVVGDFNEWDTEANKLEAKNGSWETTLRLTPGTEYRFRYLLDGERWANDDSADGYASNPYGTEDSLLVIGN
ncbi:isoamylase early set domain-containing protein [Balneolales bacterium ANBcel1]|nr:isoamylase early set domain-containing protein [Balneolales bacterium ANBcel1]